MWIITSSESGSFDSVDSVNSVDSTWVDVLDSDDASVVDCDSVDVKSPLDVLYSGVVAGIVVVGVTVVVAVRLGVSSTPSITHDVN